MVTVAAHAAHAQYGQWTFDDGASHYAHQVSTAQDGDLISCGRKTLRRHNGTTMAMEWIIEVPGFFPIDVIELSNGNIAAVGSMSGGNLLLAVFNGLGMLQWTHTYPGWYWGFNGLEVIETQSGGFMIACLGNNPSSGPGLPCAIKTESNGDVLWMKVFEDPASPFAWGAFRHVIEQVDGNGDVFYHFTGALSLNPQDGHFDTLVVTLRNDGSVVHARTIGMDVHDDWGRGMLFADESLYVTGFSKEIGEGGGTYLMKLAPNLSVLWYRSIERFTGTKDLVRVGASTVMLGGTASHPGPTPFDDAVLFGVDVNTQTVSMGMRYGGQVGDDATSFVAEAHGYALLGTSWSFGAPTLHQYIIRTDLSGISGCSENPYTPVLIPGQPIERGLTLVGHSVEPVSQTEHAAVGFSVEMRDICAGDPLCNCVEPPMGMVGWWTFDETNGNVAADSAANNNGTLLNGATFVQGKVENAVFFDGVDDRIEVPHNSLLSVNGWAGDANGSFTIDAWLYVNTSGVANGGIVEKRALFGGAGYAFMVKDSMLKVWLSDGATTQTAVSSLPLTAFGWTHVAVIVDRSSTPGEIIFVVNGVAELFPGVVTNIGPMASPVPVWIGATRWMDTPGAGGKTIPGVLDEVEFFNRALDVSEIQAIYDADACGKCKIDCNPPWDAPFCVDDQSIQVVIPVCNRSPFPMTVDLQFAGLTPATCGGIDGPTGFTILSPGNPIMIPGNGCVNVTVEIDRPAQMNSTFDVGCYELTVSDVASGASSTCRGSVQDRRDLCPLLPEDPVEMEAGIQAEINIEILVTADLEPELITWAAVAYAEDMTPSSLISINGAEPGTMAMGEFFPEPGSTVEIHLDLLTLDFAMGYSDIVLFTRSESSEGNMMPLGSFMVSIAPPTGDTPPCPADFNNDGKVDGGDLGLMLSAWGKCEKCAQDLNGDGKIDGGDLGLLLAAWGPC